MFWEGIKTIDNLADRVDWFERHITEIITEFADVFERARQEFRVILEQFVEYFRGGKKTLLKERIKLLVGIETEKRWKEKTKDDFKADLNLEKNDKGQIIATVNNLASLITACNNLKLHWDGFSNQFYFVSHNQQNLPWPHNEMDWFDVHYMIEKDVDTIRYHQAMSKYQLAELKSYLNKFIKTEINWISLKDAIISVGHRNATNIYQDFMDNGIPEWDQVDRFDFLHRFAGVKNKVHARIAAKLILLGIMARCYEPGFDFRGVVVLEGPQNSGKTRLCQLLAFHRQFYTPFQFHRNDGGYEDARQNSGMAIIEVAELGNMQKKDPNYIKAYFSMLVDINRPMHSDTVERKKRSGIFIITTNELRGYLVDDTGNTRFFPVYCDCEQIDVDGFEAELPMLFAQAKYLWMHSETPRLTLEEWKIQAETIKPREFRNDYFYCLLENLKLHRDEFQYDPNTNWDDGASMDEILEWIKSEPKFAMVPQGRMKTNAIAALRKYFHIDSVVKFMPKEKRLANDPETTRKWRYTGNVLWDDFINSLEDQ